MTEDFEFKEATFNSLIKNLKSIYEEEKELEFLNRSYNIFEVLNLERKEVALHSYFIYDLLNPEAVHGKSSIFLKFFLKEVLGYTIEKLDNFNPSDYDIRREIITKYGRIDFIINDLKNKITHIIEMKIDADDQEKQLKRYDDYAKENKNIKNYKIYYLTLDGRRSIDPSSKTVNYIPISFKINIIKWLKKILKRIDNLSNFKIFIEQYLKTIQNITNSIENDEIKNKYMESLGNDKNTIKYVNSLVKENEVIKTKVLNNLNKEIYIELTKHFSIDMKSAERYEEDYVSIYIKQVGNLKNIRFGIAVDNEKLYFYIGVCKNTACTPFEEKAINEEPYLTCFTKMEDLRKDLDVPQYYKYFYKFEKDENFILADNKEYNKLKNNILIFMKEKINELIKHSKGDE